MKAFLVGLALSLATFSAFAKGDQAGGSAVVCWDANGEVSKVTLLDLFEAKEKLAVTIDLGPKELSYQEKVKYAADRLKNVDAIMAKRIRKAADEFPKSVAFLKRSMIPNIHDQGDFLKPKSCAIGQMGAHVLNPLPLEKKYLVDAELWERADGNTRAALVIHEVVYEQARRLGEETSEHARYYTALVSSREIAKFSSGEYYKVLGGLCWIDPDKDREFWEKTGECREQIDFRTPVQNFDIDEMISITANGLPLYVTTVEFDEERRVTQGITAAKATTRTPKGEIIVPGQNWVYFKGGRLAKISPILNPVIIYGKTYSAKGVLAFEFDKKGNLSVVPLTHQ